MPAEPSPNANNLDQLPKNDPMRDPKTGAGYSSNQANTPAPDRTDDTKPPKVQDKPKNK